MTFVNHLWNLGSALGVGWMIVAALLARASVLDSPKGSDPRARFRFAFSLFGFFAVLLLASAATAAWHGQSAAELRVATGLVGTLAGVGLVSVVVFEGLVRRVRPNIPRIVPDVLTTIAGLVALMRASSHLGLDLSGIIATSAVLTAVIGLSLQDTLGNILGGLALQMDGSIEVGDWVKIGDLSGRVSEIRWRYTAIETRNWETVIFPNSMLTRGQVMVLGKRSGQPEQWRRWVYFHVDFRHAPTDVIAVVTQALLAQPIRNVAATPAPNCIAMDFDQSSTKYAVRYWLTDLAVDDPTDSEIRTRIFFALARAKMSPAIPAQTVFVTEHDEERAQAKREADFERRVKALQGVTIFRDLSDEERSALAESLHRAPFAAGETMTREGATAHHLYILVRGEVSVRVGGIEQTNEVAQLRAGAFFGEMALLTGEKRRATCIALSDVDCYRLDWGAFRGLLERHPELAEQVAAVLVERQADLEAVRERVDVAQDAKRRAESQRDLAFKIRTFFQLD
ncbi:MAG: mechanosensitive ion channel family protein [Polyangiales bacterium]|nr:mechanosensitive ion channel [Myxococcales bacterium]MCB9656660.1 mechanosensitive ion channel [Sandaracinaceae bacterium]